MKLAEGYIFLTRPQNRSHEQILHIIHESSKKRDPCLCGAVLLGVNKWSVVENIDDTRVSKRCKQAHEKMMRLKRWSF